MAEQKFRTFLITKGLKLTKERFEILDEVLSSDRHFDPEELYESMRTKGSKVSRASVYRTIPLLVEGGIIQEVERISKHAHYEKVFNVPHHDHLICLDCGSVTEFFSPTLEMLQSEICQKENFKSIRHSLEIFGYCSKCSKLNK
ncbi:MAG: transcriptional repressor [Dissulfurispiraceae bacterium]|nr:transcriptional repressor [Dissulfurispiraceae bacterium]